MRAIADAPKQKGKKDCMKSILNEVILQKSRLKRELLDSYAQSRMDIL